MTYTEFILKVYNFVDSIYMVYIVAFFAFLGLGYKSLHCKKVNKECERLTNLVVDLEKKEWCK